LIPVRPGSSLAITQIDVDGKVVRLVAHVAGSSAVCPGCQHLSTHIHDRHVRRPMDLPWRGYAVRLALMVRRFRGANPACPGSTFTETVGEHLPKRARRTTAATDTLVDLARADGGEGGARVARRIGLPISPDTLLRLLRGRAQRAVPTPRVLGVDDFALRRGERYATVLVDLESREPIDLLEGRDAAVLEKWLQEHLGVEVVVRDRAEAYAEGASQGAPDAQQVADRFHLSQNASAAMDELLRGRRRSIEQSEESHSPTDAASDPAKPESRRQRERRQRRERRVGRWRRVKELRLKGHSITRISRATGMDRRTIRNYLATPEEPRRQVKNPRPQGFSSPTLQPFQTYLQDRWEQGCTNISQLFREIVAKGYRGSRSLVNQALLPWRSPRPPNSAAKKRRISVRWLCLRRPDQLDPLETKLLAQLLAEDPGLAQGYALLQRFRQTLRDRQVDALRAWIADARASALRAFQAFANGLLDDWSAVEAAFTTSWSTGPVEGHVNRIKLIKRSGFGRMKVDLLRSRVLAA
jgi:transposase